MTRELTPKHGRSAIRETRASRPATSQATVAKPVDLRLTYFLIAAICAVSGILSVVRLGTPYFWDDETYVAITARNLLRFGRLTLWDGRNLFSNVGGGFQGHIPSFDTILTALSFSLFGESTASARLPFAVCSILTLALFVYVVREIVPNRPRMLVFATVLLGLSTQFLLLARTCRYYALAVFFGLLTYACYRWYVRSRTLAAAASLTLAALLLYYAHVLSAAAMLGAIAVIHFSFYSRALGWRAHLPLLLSGVTFISITVPIAILEHTFDFQNANPTADDQSLMRKVTLVIWNLRDLNLITALPWVISFCLIVFLIATRRSSRWKDVWLACREWLVISAAYAIVLGLLSPQLPSNTRIADVRYLFPVLPFAAGAVACFLTWMAARNWSAAVLILCLLICTNLFSWTPFVQSLPASSRVRWLLPAFVAEITHPYPTCNEAVSDFLRQNAKQDQVVATFPSFFGFPLIYYVGDKVKIGCLLATDVPSVEQFTKGKGASLFSATTYPDWIICYGAPADPFRVLQYFGRVHREGSRIVRRIYHPVRAIEVYPVQTQRPEIPWHEFGPQPANAQTGAGVYIFEGGDTVPVPPASAPASAYQ